MQKRTTDTGFQIDALSSLSDRRILLDADLSGRERHPPSLILEPPLKNSRRRVKCDFLPKSAAIFSDRLL